LSEVNFEEETLAFVPHPRSDIHDGGYTVNVTNVVKRPGFLTFVATITEPYPCCPRSNYRGVIRRALATVILPKQEPGIESELAANLVYVPCPAGAFAPPAPEGCPTDKK
jgi:hypothetical protein